MARQRKINVLVVDDRPENLMALEKLLEAPDRNIVKATSGNDALALALEHEFALVLMDVQMPDMDGFETAALMRSAGETKNVPIIFVTAISKEPQHVFKGYGAGAVDYLFKPLDPDILVAKVNLFLELYRQKLALREANENLQQANRKILAQQKSLIEKERQDVLFQLAGTTAHELNQPLMILLGAIELMAVHRNDPRKILQYADKAKTAGERIAEIVKRIQNLRRDETMLYAGNVPLINLHQKVKVLCMEETKGALSAVRARLKEEESLEWRHVPDREAAFRELEKAAYDMILIDSLGPAEAAEAFLEAANRKKIEVPILVVIDKGADARATRLLSAGAAGLVSKGESNPGALLREIQQVLEKTRLRQAARRAQEKLTDMAIRDSLTQLYNRRYFTEVLEKELFRARRHGAPFSVCILALDSFGTVNATHGPAAGDALLMETARRLTSGFRKGDVVCRYDGAKFAVLLHRSDTREAGAACEAFRKTVESQVIEHNGAHLPVRIRMGLETCDPNFAGSPEELMGRAEQSLLGETNEGPPSF